MDTMTASLGGWLTQRGYVPEEERILAKEVSGFGNLEELYREATDEEIAEYQKRQQEAHEQTTDGSLIV